MTTFGYDPVPFNVNPQGNTFPFGATLTTQQGAGSSSFFDPSWMDQPFSTSISNPGGGMAFPWMAAATVAAPVLGGIFSGGAAQNTRAGGAEAVGLAATANQDYALGAFGGVERQRDAERARQLGVSLDRLNLMDSGPYLNALRRNEGYRLAGLKYTPGQIAQFGDMFGGYS